MINGPHGVRTCDHLPWCWRPPWRRQRRQRWRARTRWSIAGTSRQRPGAGGTGLGPCNDAVSFDLDFSLFFTPYALIQCHDVSCQFGLNSPFKKLPVSLKVTANLKIPPGLTSKRLRDKGQRGKGHGGSKKKSSTVDCFYFLS